MTSPPFDLSLKLSPSQTFNFPAFFKTPKASSLSVTRTSSIVLPTTTPRAKANKNDIPIQAQTTQTVQRPKTKQGTVTHRRTVSFQKAKTNTMIPTSQLKKSAMRQSTSPNPRSPSEKKRPPKLLIPDTTIKPKTQKSASKSPMKKEPKSSKLKDSEAPNYLKPTLSSLQSVKEPKPKAESPTRNFDMSKPQHVYGEYYTPSSGGIKSDWPNKGSESQRSLKKKETPSPYSAKKKDIASPYSAKKRASDASPYSCTQKSKSPLTKGLNMKTVDQAKKPSKPKKIRGFSLATMKLPDEVMMATQTERLPGEDKKLQKVVLKIPKASSMKDIDVDKEDVVVSVGIARDQQEREKAKTYREKPVRVRDDSTEPLCLAPATLETGVPDDSCKGTVTEIFDTNKSSRRQSRDFLLGSSSKPFFTPRDPRKDLFFSKTGNYFAINKDSNNWLSEIESKYSYALLTARSGEQALKSVADQIEEEEKVLLKDAKPIVIVVDQKNKIIQPAYMKRMGTMCFTELWPKKINRQFLHSVKDEAPDLKLTHSKAKLRQYETLFKPKKWNNEEKLNKRIATMNSQWGDALEIKAKAMKSQWELYREAAKTIIKKSLEATQKKEADLEEIKPVISAKNDKIKKRLANIEERMQKMLANPRRKSVVVSKPMV